MNRWFSVVCVASLMAALGSVCVLSTLAVGTARADLSLQISSAKTRYLVDEPLFVTVIVRNQGPADAAISRYLDPMLGLLTFEVVPPGESARPYGQCTHASLDRSGLANTVVNLAPGEQYSGVAELTCEVKDRQGGLLLSAAGNYILRGTYAIPEGWPVPPLKVQSNDLSLEVLDPEGEDRAAHEILLQGAATAGHALWSAAREQASCYETLLREYPGSGYAIHAKWYLAQVYHCDGTIGQLGLRGTPAAVTALENAAALCLSVAADAGQTPLALMAVRLAATESAMVGRASEAQALLQQTFLSPAATDDDRLDAVRLMEHVETGLFYEESGLASGKVATTQVRLPLRQFARALGLSLSWDPATKTTTIRGRKVKSTLQPGKKSMFVNGEKRTGVRTWFAKGNTEVSLSVIATLMAEQRGKGVANALSGLIARAPKVRKGATPGTG
jgi:hypothetical protein